MFKKVIVALTIIAATYTVAVPISAADTIAPVQHLTCNVGSGFATAERSAVYKNGIFELATREGDEISLNNKEAFWLDNAGNAIAHFDLSQCPTSRDDFVYIPYLQKIGSLELLERGNERLFCELLIWRYKLC